MLKHHVHFSTISNEESLELNKTWRKGAFNFLSQRTLNHYNKAKTTIRRASLEQDLNMVLPLLDDGLLEKLYWLVIPEYQLKLKQYSNSGFDLTSYEISFMKMFNEIKSQISKLDGVALTPMSGETRMVVGPYLPDFLLFGLSIKGYSLIAIEVDGGIHSLKQSKDFKKQDDLMELGIYTISIQNNQVGDKDFLTKLLKDEKIINIQKRSPEQIKSALRRIWVKTIVNHWTIERIDDELIRASGIDFGLKEEFRRVVKLKNCPREIRKEFNNC